MSATSEDIERGRREREREAMRVNKLNEIRAKAAEAVEYFSAKDIRRLAYQKQISPEFAHWLVELKRNGG